MKSRKDLLKELWDYFKDIEPQTEVEKYYLEEIEKVLGIK